LLAKIDEIAPLLRFDITDILSQFMYIDRAVHGFSLMNVQGVRNFYTKHTLNPREYTNPGLLDNPRDFIGQLTRIVTNWSQAASIPGVTTLLRLNANSRYFIATFLHRQGLDLGNQTYRDEFRAVVESLMRIFVVEEAFGTGYSTALIKGFLFEANRTLIDQSVPVERIYQSFRSHMAANFHRDDLISRLTAYRGYGLVYICEYLTNPVAVTTGLGDIEIEHIMPQSGQNISVIRDDAGLEDEELFDDYKNKLGNLVLLEKSINGTIGNSWFKSKLGGYAQSKMPAVGELLEEGHSQWTWEEIDRRTEALSIRMADFVFGDVA
jgi:hypothetical protein